MASEWCIQRDETCGLSSRWIPASSAEQVSRGGYEQDGVHRGEGQHTGASLRS